MQVEVLSYSGYKDDERPMRFRLNGVERAVLSIEDRWYGPDDDWFRVQASDGHGYILRRSRKSGEWSVSAFSSR